MKTSTPRSLTTMLTLLLLAFSLFGCSSAPIESGTPATEAELGLGTGTTSLECVQPKVLYWRQFCAQLVRPVAATVCVGAPPVNVNTCANAYNETFPICNMQAARQYLACSLQHTEDYVCQGGDTNTIPWVATLGTACSELELAAFGC